MFKLFAEEALHSNYFITLFGNLLLYYYWLAQMESKDSNCTCIGTTTIRITAKHQTASKIRNE